MTNFQYFFKWIEVDDHFYKLLGLIAITLLLLPDVIRSFSKKNDGNS
jgi:hypothetical protein